MNILFAPADYTFSNRAGSKPSWCYYYIKTLLHKGHKITIICDNEDKTSKIKHKNLKVISRSKDYNPKPSIFQAGTFQIWMAIKIPLILKKEPTFDIVHHFGNFGNRTSFNLTLILGIFKNLPFVFGPLEEEVKTSDNNWGWISNTEKQILKFADKFIFKKLVKKTLQKSSVVVCQGQAALEYYKKIYQREYLIIPPGIENIENIKINPKGENVNLITIGALNKLKRMDLIIKVFKNLNKSYPNLTLKIIGTGPEKENLEKLILNSQLDKSVKLMGHISPNAVKAELAKGDIYINAALYESFGQAMLESMSFSIPIVASNTPGAKILIEDNKSGFLIEQNEREEKEFEKKLSILIRNTEMRNSFSKNSKERVERLFLWDKITNKYIDIYEKLLNAS